MLQLAFMGRKLLFLQTEDWTFWSHRMPLARAAKAAGYEVVIAVRVEAHGDLIRAEGFRVVALEWRRNSLNPLRELLMLCAIVRLYAREKPDIVHQVTAKPIFYGTIAAGVTGVRAIVNTLTGLGSIFSSDTWMARLLRPSIRYAFRAALAISNSATIFQNRDDLSLFVSGGLVDEGKSALIRGSGVDIDKFYFRPEPVGVPLVVLPARMIWEKGVGEFVEAARLLTADGVRARFALLGDRDAENPAAIPAAQLAQWKQDGPVEWWGNRADMPEVFSQAHIVCLPTYYGEGLPKALLEGAACGRALVAADVPGSREIVRHEETGLLVPPKDARALAAALKRLISDKSLREKLGIRARQAACDEFSQEKVVEQTLSVYRNLLR